MGADEWVVNRMLRIRGMDGGDRAQPCLPLAFPKVLVRGPHAAREIVRGEQEGRKRRRPDAAARFPCAGTHEAKLRRERSPGHRGRCSWRCRLNPELR